MQYNSYRRKTKPIIVGGVGIGGDYPVSIQSMTNTHPLDVMATYQQVLAIEAAGGDIVRMTVPDEESADTIKQLRALGVKIPIVADVHFDYKAALAAVKCGADKIRINPGNIGSRERIRAVADACRERKIPIRIGVNSGSLEKKILEKHKGPTAEALVESALYHASLLHELDFHDIAVSVKSSDVMVTVQANRILAANTEYPIHIGVTEAGGGDMALIKSSIGIGALLSAGIGDTVRVSLTDKPEREISAARSILRSLGLIGGMNVISCPTCGRTGVDLISLHDELMKRVLALGLDSKDIKVALMGCAVNGPGEASEADVGIAAGVAEGLLFRKGKIIKRVKEDRLIDELIKEIIDFK